MSTRTSGAARASVSVEDISRQYYEAAGYSMWITQLHVDPLELIVADDSTGKLFRVPVELGKGGAFAFGEAQEVAIEYKDVKTPAGSKAAASMPFRWPTKAAALSAAGIAEPVGLTAHDGTPVVITDDPPPERRVERSLPPGEAIKRVAAAAPATKTPDAAPATGQPDNTQKEASVDAAKLREALGLPADATKAQMQEAMAAAFSDENDTPPEGGTDLKSPTHLPATLKAEAVMIDSSHLAALQAAAAKGELAWRAQQASERDTFLHKACEVEGRFPPSKLAHYKELWDKNPKDTKEYVLMLTKNTIPTSSAGYLGAALDADQATRDYEAVYGPKGA